MKYNTSHDTQNKKGIVRTTIMDQKVVVTIVGAYMIEISIEHYFLYWNYRILEMIMVCWVEYGKKFSIE